MSPRKLPPTPKYLCERLRMVRRRLALDTARLANKAGCHPEIIAGIESGVITKPLNINRIAAALGVSPIWLQFGEPWA